MLNLRWDPSILPKGIVSHDKCPRVGEKYCECCPSSDPSSHFVTAHPDGRLRIGSDKLDLTPYGSICSQVGQDTLLVQIFNTIGLENKYFVEFGARIPEQLNSSHFRLNCGWNGLLMDGDRGLDCYGQKAGMDLVKNEYITKENINDIFKKNNVPSRFDLLTIDVDWNDYWLFKALDTHKFSPNVVCIEFSSYFRADEPFVVPYFPEVCVLPLSSSVNAGTSLAALNKLAKSKGYSYVCHADGYHAIFVKTSLLHEEDKNIEIPYKIEHGWYHELRVRHEKDNAVTHKTFVNVSRIWNDKNLIEVEFEVDKDFCHV